jgi:hypothetical protein
MRLAREAGREKGRRREGEGREKGTNFYRR